MTRYVVAVVGAGPSGIYAAEALTQQSEIEVDVAVIDRLPVPFGLVRYGVAPDHPSIRSIRTTLERTLDKAGVRFFGDVMIGRDLQVDELRGAVDAIIYAWGAGASRRLDIDGEDAFGSLSAPDFVAWYCGHPDVHRDVHPAESVVADDQVEMSELLDGATSAVVVGAGNVALDVTRVLIKTADELASTDMAREVLSVLGDKTITDVHLLARRGPAYTQMTTKELRELGAIDDCDVFVHPADLDWDAEYAHGVGKVATRNLDLIKGWADGSRQQDGSRRIHLHFWTRPTSITLAHDELHDTDRVAAVEFVDNRPGGAATGSVAAQLVVRAIGYYGIELPGVPFDTDSGRVPHIEGRVLHTAPGGGAAADFAVGEYVTGWIKRGPTGVIGTNKSDAVETVHSLLLDIAEGDLSATHPRGLAGLAQLLLSHGITPLDLPAWHRIDAAEIDRGHADGRDRTTLAHRSELLDAARAQPTG